MMKATHLSMILLVSFTTIGCDNRSDQAETLLDAAKKISPRFGIKSVAADERSGDRIENDATPTPPVENVSDSKKKTSNKNTVDKMNVITDTPDNEPMVVEITKTDGLGLMELIIAEGIESRRPVKPNTRFEQGTYERLYAFIKVKNPEQIADEITVAWAPLNNEERQRGEVSVSVGAQKKWRTWAFTRTIQTVGKWQVIVKNKNGEILGKAPFEVVAPN